MDGIPQPHGYSPALGRSLITKNGGWCGVQLAILSFVLDLAYGRITTERNKRLAINVPMKMIAGAGLFSFTDSRLISSKELNPINFIINQIQSAAIIAITGPQKAIMLSIAGNRSRNDCHEPGARTYEMVCPNTSAKSAISIHMIVFLFLLVIAFSQSFFLD
jgi:hypothetical protein